LLFFVFRAADKREWGPKRRGELLKLCTDSAAAILPHMVRSIA
jgi:hypothetical protein